MKFAAFALTAAMALLQLSRPVNALSTNSRNTTIRAELPLLELKNGTLLPYGTYRLISGAVVNITRAVDEPPTVRTNLTTRNMIETANQCLGAIAPGTSISISACSTVCSAMANNETWIGLPSGASVFFFSPDIQCHYKIQNWNSCDQVWFQPTSYADNCFEGVAQCLNHAYMGQWTNFDNPKISGSLVAAATIRYKSGSDWIATPVTEPSNSSSCESNIWDAEPPAYCWNQNSAGATTDGVWLCSS